MPNNDVEEFHRRVRRLGYLIDSRGEPWKVPEDLVDIFKERWTDLCADLDGPDPAQPNERPDPKVWYVIGHPRQGWRESVREDLDNRIHVPIWSSAGRLGDVVADEVSMSVRSALELAAELITVCNGFMQRGDIAAALARTEGGPV